MEAIVTLLQSINASFTQVLYASGGLGLFTARRDPPRSLSSVLFDAIIVQLVFCFVKGEEWPSALAPRSFENQISWFYSIFYSVPPVAQVLVVFSVRLIASWLRTELSHLYDNSGLSEKLTGDRYCYQKLPAHCTRILQVSRSWPFPWRRKFKLSSVCDADLAEGLSYDAVSYTWDGQVKSSYIQIDGKVLGITQNVRDILKEFTPKGVGRRNLWIDAICIDQSSATDKSTQVRNMGAIYRNSTKVLVWLGPTAPSTSLTAPPECWLLNRAFSAPQRIARGLLLGHRYWSRAWIVQEIVLGNIIEIHFMGEIVYWERLKDIIRPPPRLCIRHPDDIYYHDRTISWEQRKKWARSPPWLHWVAEPGDLDAKRCEVFNYFTSADHIATLGDDIAYGRKHMARNEPGHTGPQPLLPRFIEPPAHVDAASLRGLRQILRIDTLRKAKFSPARHHRQTEVLLLSASTVSANPRDKIFAFLDLPTSQTGYGYLGVDVDYTQPAEKLFRKIAQEIWGERGAANDGDLFFDPLRLSGIGWAPLSHRRLPSWATNWSALPDTLHDGFSVMLLEGFQAGGERRERIEGHLEGDLLILKRSCRVDKIRSLSGIINMDRQDDHVTSWDIASQRSWLHEICNMVEKNILRFHDKLLPWSRDYRYCPNLWRGAILRTLIARAESLYWSSPAGIENDGWSLHEWDRPDRSNTEELLKWYNLWSGYNLTRSDVPRPDIKDELEVAFEVWVRLPALLQLVAAGKLKPQRDELRSLIAQGARFSLASRPHVQGRRFAITETGHMCLVAPISRNGDEIWINEHSPFPYLYRRLPKKPQARGRPRRVKGFMVGSRHYPRTRRVPVIKLQHPPIRRVVGHCFAFGLMNGERTILAGDGSRDLERWRNRSEVILI